jgi:hypothetical protein
MEGTAVAAIMAMVATAEARLSGVEPMAINIRKWDPRRDRVPTGRDVVMNAWRIKGSQCLLWIQ